MRCIILKAEFFFFLFVCSLYRFRCASMDPSSDSALALATTVTIWNLYKKVRWESFFWGAGTAIGELPPYFVARAGKTSQSLALFDKKKEVTNLIVTIY